MLAYPDPSKAFVFDTDVCDSGIGPVLSQLHEGGEGVVTYASHTLCKTEKNDSTTRKELLAVVVFLKHFQHYLLGRKFLLRTDHSSLHWLNNFKHPEGQLARWLEQLGHFEYEIVHRSGKLHRNADVVSRSVTCYTQEKQVYNGVS